jgi:hypothetical protein
MSDEPDGRPSILSDEPDGRLSILANGIHGVLVGIFGDPNFEFVLVVARPSREDGTVKLNTITGIKDATNLRTIAAHLSDMANDIANTVVVEDEIRKALLENDDNIEGHA